MKRKNKNKYPKKKGARHLRSVWPVPKNGNFVNRGRMRLLQRISYPCHSKMKRKNKV